MTREAAEAVREVALCLQVEAAVLRKKRYDETGADKIEDDLLTVLDRVVDKLLVKSLRLEG